MAPLQKRAFYGLIVCVIWAIALVVIFVTKGGIDSFVVDRGFEALMVGTLVAGFLRGYDVCVPRDMMLARIRRCRRMWGALALRSTGADFHWDSRRAFSSIGAVATQLTDRIDEERVRAVRARIDQKIVEQIRPKDLFHKKES